MDFKEKPCGNIQLLTFEAFCSHVYTKQSKAFQILPLAPVWLWPSLMDLVHRVLLSGEEIPLPSFPTNQKLYGRMIQQVEP